MSRILLTGGAGFIGSHTARALLARGDEVVVLDDFNDFYDPAIKRRNVEPFIERLDCRLVEGDIRDRDLIRSPRVARTGRDGVPTAHGGQR